MQGDIFQLEDILRHQAKDTTADSTIAHLAIRHYDDESPFISVYNEDDYSDYLFRECPVTTTKAKPITPKQDSTPQSQKAHYLESIASAFDDYYTDSPSVINTTNLHHHHQHHKWGHSHTHFSVQEVPEDYYSDDYDEDECAISTDDDEDDDQEHQGPATPIDSRICHYHTRHIASPPDSNLPPMRPVLGRKRDSSRVLPLVQQPVAATALKAGNMTASSAAATTTSVVIPPQHHVNRISGPLMSWWPAPIEQLEYDWNEKFYD